MNEKNRTRSFQPEQMRAAGGGAYQLGIYKPGLKHREESMAFFRELVGEETYRRAMSSEVGRRHHYAAVRAFLDQASWEKFVWIEEYGSLDGFPEQ